MGEKLGGCEGSVGGIETAACECVLPSRARLPSGSSSRVSCQTSAPSGRPSGPGQAGQRRGTATTARSPWRRAKAKTCSPLAPVASAGMYSPAVKSPG